MNKFCKVHDCEEFREPGDEYFCIEHGVNWSNFFVKHSPHYVNKTTRVGKRLMKLFLNGEK